MLGTHLDNDIVLFSSLCAVSGVSFYSKTKRMYLFKSTLSLEQSSKLVHTKFILFGQNLLVWQNLSWLHCVTFHSIFSVFRSVQHKKISRFRFFLTMWCLFRDTSKSHWISKDSTNQVTQGQSDFSFFPWSFLVDDDMTGMFVLHVPCWWWWLTYFCCCVGHI